MTDKPDAPEPNKVTQSPTERNNSSELKKALFQVSDGILGAAILICLGVWVGGVLDKQFHSAPWGSIVTSLLGGALGLIRLIRKAMAIGQLTSDKPLRTAKPASGAGQQAESDSQPASGPKSAYKKWDDEDD